MKKKKDHMCISIILYLTNLSEIINLKKKLEKKKLKKINIFMVLKDQTVPLEQEIILD